MYAKHIKRAADIVLAFLALLLLGWLICIVALLVRVKLGSPVLFKQPRPGKDGQIFLLYKFRTMTDERDEEGRLLPDEVRLTSFGRVLRASSLDELPEIFNILKGDMSFVGPRPQLVRDMVFMDMRQRSRHQVRPGLTGLAQVNGRNSITWDSKLDMDIQYLERITFLKDASIMFATIGKVFKREGISAEGLDTAQDYGDYLLECGRVSEDEYAAKQREAIKDIEQFWHNGASGTY